MAGERQQQPKRDGAPKKAATQTPRTGTSSGQRFTTGATVGDIRRGNPRTPNRRSRG